MAVWITLIVATAIQGSRLGRLFRDGYPEIALRELPSLFEYRRDPEKLFYFFRGRCVEAFRLHPELWRERQRFVRLVTATLGFWIALGITIGVIALTVT